MHVRTLTTLRFALIEIVCDLNNIFEATMKRLLTYTAALSFSAVLLCIVNVSAEIHTEVVEYRHGEARLEGYLAYDNSLKGNNPGIIVVHAWKGTGPYVKSRTEQLAAMGYVAFAPDIYGKGIRPKTNKEAAAQAGIYRQDRKLMRARVQAGLTQLNQHKLVDPKRIAAIGYCFGGGVVLELARSGADIAGVVSFHGNLDTPDPADAKNIVARVLVLHGADDPHVPEQQLTAFKQEMRAGDVDWQVISYGGAVHSFTNPQSGNNPSRGVAYNKKADLRSWAAIKLFFDELFSK